MQASTEPRGRVHWIHRPLAGRLSTGFLLFVWIWAPLLLSVLPGGGLLALLLVVTVVTRVAHRDPRRAAVYALAPFVPGLIVAAIGLARGEPRILGGSFLDPEAGNLDRSCRVDAAAHGGCFPWVGLSLFVEVPNNAAVCVASALFGPPDGVYTGPYPTKAEAKALARDRGRRPTLLEMQALGELTYHSGRPVALDDLTPRFSRSDLPAGPPDVRVVPLGDEGLLVQAGDDGPIALADLATGIVFASYVR